MLWRYAPFPAWHALFIGSRCWPFFLCSLVYVCVISFFIPISKNMVSLPTEVVTKWKLISSQKSFNLYKFVLSCQVWYKWRVLRERSAAWICCQAVWRGRSQKKWTNWKESNREKWGGQEKKAGAIIRDNALEVMSEKKPHGGMFLFVNHAFIRQKGCRTAFRSLGFNQFYF